MKLIYIYLLVSFLFGITVFGQEELSTAFVPKERVDIPSYEPRYAKAGEDYLVVYLKHGYIPENWLEDFRVGTYIQTEFRTASDGNARVEVLSGSKDFQQIYREDSAVTDYFNEKLFGPVPYNGGLFTIDYSFISVRTKNLVGGVFNIFKPIIEKSKEPVIQMLVSNTELIKSAYNFLSPHTRLVARYRTTFDEGAIQLGYYLLLSEGALDTYRLEDLRLVSAVTGTDIVAVDAGGNNLSKAYAIVEIRGAKFRSAEEVEIISSVRSILNDFKSLVASLGTRNIEMLSFEPFMPDDVNSRDQVESARDKYCEYLENRKFFSTIDRDVSMLGNLHAFDSRVNELNDLTVIEKNELKLELRRSYFREYDDYLEEINRLKSKVCDSSIDDFYKIMNIAPVR